MRQHAVRPFRLPVRGGRWSGREFWLGHELVDVIHVQKELGRVAFAGLRERDSKVCADLCRIAPKNDDAVRELNGFLDVVRYQENTLRRNLLPEPQLHQFAAQVLRGKNIES